MPLIRLDHVGKLDIVLPWSRIKIVFHTQSLAYDALRAGTLSAEPLAAPFFTLVQHAHDGIAEATTQTTEHVGTDMPDASSSTNHDGIAVQ